MMRFVAGVCLILAAMPAAVLAAPTLYASDGSFLYRINPTTAAATQVMSNHDTNAAWGEGYIGYPGMTDGPGHNVWTTGGTGGTSLRLREIDPTQPNPAGAVGAPGSMARSVHTVTNMPAGLAAGQAQGLAYSKAENAFYVSYYPGVYTQAYVVKVDAATYAATAWGVANSTGGEWLFWQGLGIDRASGRLFSPCSAQTRLWDIDTSTVNGSVTGSASAIGFSSRGFIVPVNTQAADMGDGRLWGIVNGGGSALWSWLPGAGAVTTIGNTGIGGGGNLFGLAAIYIPEPASLGLLAVAAGLLAARRRD